MLRKIWGRWFKDSEVNFLADLFTFIGALSEILFVVADEPGLREILVSLGISPVWLMLIGIAVRTARRLRDPEMRISS